MCASPIPEGERDAYLGRWVRVELVGRLMSDAVRWLPHDEREEFFDAVRAILRERIPSSAVRSLSPAWRRRVEEVAGGTSEEFYQAIDAREPTSLPTRLRHGILRATSRLTRGSMHRRLTAWARTPILVARQAAAVAAATLAAAAVVLTVIDIGASVALGLALAALGLTTLLTIRSTSGTGTAIRQSLALAPAAIVAVRGSDSSLIAAAAVAAVAIGGGLVADRAWRRRDIRAHAARDGGPLDRLGWIGASAVAVGVAVAGVDAFALLTGADG